MPRGGAAADAYSPDVYESTHTIRLTEDGLLQMDRDVPDPYDGWDGYTNGLKKMLESGLTSEFVEKELIPFHLDPVRLLKPRVREFYTDPVMNLFYTAEAVTGAQQVWMHPKFELASRLFEFRQGCLSFGNMFKEYERKARPDGPNVERSRSFSATLVELKQVVSDANGEREELARQAGVGPDHHLSRRIKATANSRIIAEALWAIGYVHYEGNPDPTNFIAIIDEVYRDQTADILLMRRLPNIGDDPEPLYAVAGAVCGHLNVGIAAPPIPIPVAAENSQPYASIVQCVRFFNNIGPLGDGPISTVETIYAIFFRVGRTEVDENVSVPHFLCHGRKYQQLSGFNHAGNLADGNQMWRTNVYYLSDRYEDDPRWHFAPPMAALKANAFIAQLPLTKSEINGEVLRGIVLVLSPRADLEFGEFVDQNWDDRKDDMADVYSLDRARPEIVGADLVHKLGSLQLEHPLTFYTPRTSDAAVFQMGSYTYTIEGPVQRIGSNPHRLRTSRFTVSERREAVRILPKTPTDKETWEYLKTENDCHELHFRPGDPNPIWYTPLHRLHRMYDKATTNREQQTMIGRLGAAAAQMAANSLARRKAREAEAEAEAEAKAANRASAEEARQADRDRDKERRIAAKERAAALEAQKVQLTDEEREELARRAAEAAKADRKRLAEVEEERRARERRAREEAKRGKAKVSPQEAYKKAQEAKAVAKAQAAQSSRQANLRAADPNPARQAPAPVVAQVVQNMLEDQPRGGGGARGGKKGGRRGGR
jgi:hypothetical protein